MIQSLSKHIESMLPAWIFGIIMAGLGVFVTVVVAWYNIDRDLSLVLCKLGIEENNLCRWTTTIEEDLTKTIVEQGSEGSE